MLSDQDHYFQSMAHYISTVDFKQNLYKYMSLYKIVHTVFIRIEARVSIFYK